MNYYLNTVNEVFFENNKEFHHLSATFCLIISFLLQNYNLNKLRNLKIVKTKRRSKLSIKVSKGLGKFFI